MKQLDIGVVFKFENTIKNILIKNSPKDNCNVIYKIPCKDCNSIYIGQTGKDIDSRIAQHKYSIRTGQASNSLFVHLRDFGHRINWNLSSVICKSNNFIERNIIESSLIQITWQNNMNTSKGLYSLDQVILSMMERDFIHLKDKLIPQGSNEVR